MYAVWLETISPFITRKSLVSFDISRSRYIPTYQPISQTHFIFSFGAIYVHIRYFQNYLCNFTPQKSFKSTIRIVLNTLNTRWDFSYDIVTTFHGSWIPTTIQSSSFYGSPSCFITHKIADTPFTIWLSQSQRIPFKQICLILQKNSLGTSLALIISYEGILPTISCMVGKYYRTRGIPSVQFLAWLVQWYILSYDEIPRVRCFAWLVNTIVRSDSQSWNNSYAHR